LAATVLRLSAQKATKREAAALVLAAGLKNQALKEQAALETTLLATAKDRLAARHAAADLALHAKEERVLLVAAKDAQAHLATEEKALHLVEKDAHLVAAKDARLVRHLAAVKENLTPKVHQEDLLAPADRQARKNAGSNFCH
jgi:hypothetical protein